jgi:predicted regulator of Ras-like GTPase activity (Roadblock/LC7/MglB family)
LHEILNDVVNSSSDIIGAAAVDNDGLLMASNFNSSIDSNRIAAVTAGLISLATRSAQQLNQGAVKQTLIQAEKGNIIAIRANPQISLVILTSVDINLGLAFMKCRDAAQAIGNML